MNDKVNCIRCTKSMDLDTEAIPGYKNSYSDQDSYWCGSCWYVKEFLHDALEKSFLESYQPERSKREDSDCSMRCRYDHGCGWTGSLCEEHESTCNIEMRCSEHCGNTMRGK